MDYIICALVGFGICFSLMPVALLISRRLGAVSDIGERHVGAVPIGRLGGLGVLVGVFSATVTMVVSCSSNGDSFLDQKRGEIFSIFIGVLLVGGIGILDDIIRVSAKIKLFFQLLASVIVYYYGIRISVVDFPLSEPISLGWLSLPITVVWIVGIVNSINLIDGLDGLAGGVIFFASIVNFIASIAFKATISSFLMASIGGSILGFLIYNWFPAKIYLGDGGAYALGFLLAISALIAPLQKATTAVAILVPILAFGLPICDTAITLLRRWLSGKNILSPDRGHLHHLFLDAGISHRQVVIGMYCMSAFSGSIGVAITLKRNPIIGCFLVVLTGFAVAWWGFKMKSYLIRLYKNKLR